MNLKIPILLFVFQICFSQTEKSIKGTILYNNLPIANVDVVNEHLRISTKTDQKGLFFIKAKIEDHLVFISKEFQLERIKLTEKDFHQGNLIINLRLKPEELKEVVITKMPSVRLSLDENYEQGKLNELSLSKTQSQLKNASVYDGQTSGMDFLKIGAIVGKLFAKEKVPIKVDPPQIVFKELVNQKFEPDFYTKTLHLKEENVARFLEFCDADPKSKEFEKNNNQLALLDF